MSLMMLDQIASSHPRVSDSSECRRCHKSVLCVESHAAGCYRGGMITTGNDVERELRKAE
jgi:hypothetical protein